jgi:hypothetical protein
VAACTSNDSPTEVGDGSDFEGFWVLTVDVTEANGICDGEETEDPSVLDVLITQEGAEINATAMWTDESGSVTLTGTRAGQQISFSGSYAEDSGTTSSLYTLTIGEGTLNGREDWSWTGPGGTCPLGLATVTGVPR